MISSAVGVLATAHRDGGRVTVALRVPHVSDEVTQPSSGFEAKFVATTIFRLEEGTMRAFHRHGNRRLQD
jgi:hypothetical protein